MNNKWFKLALVSFTGIIVSIFGLYFVQLFGGQDAHGAAGHQMGTMQTTGTHTSHTPSGGTTHAQPTGIPGYPQVAPGYGYQNHDVQAQLMQMRNQINQMMYQMNYLTNSLNNMNNMNNMNNSNMNMSGGMSMPMM